MKLISIPGNRISSFNAPKQNLNLSFERLCRPQIPSDSFVRSRTSVSDLNSGLLCEFGIFSEINNADILLPFAAAVENFCKINRNKSLFSNLKLRYGNISENMQSFPEAGVIFFNPALNSRALYEKTKSAYDNGHIPCFDPLYSFYYQLADHLNYRFNPAAHKVTRSSDFSLNMRNIPDRLSSSGNVNDFKNHYIAARMCGHRTSRDMDLKFMETSGNTALSYPLPKNLLSGSFFGFNTIEQAQRFLNGYGITSEFPNVFEANLCAGAVYDLINSVQNNAVFAGLKIRMPQEYFNNTCVMGAFRFRPKECEILLNPAYNWMNSQQLAAFDYNNGFHPTYLPKDTYIHELSHFLDYMGNINFFAAKNKGRNLKNFLNKYSFPANKVSSYALENPREFCAEYVCGRMAGLKYPKITDDLFASYWGGPVLNFPSID